MKAFFKFWVIGWPLCFRAVVLTFGWSEVAQLCPTLCDPMDCSLSGSSVHGIFQARVLEWIAISFSRGSSQPRNWTPVPHIAGRCFTVWATREAHIWVALEKHLRSWWRRQRLIGLGPGTCLVLLSPTWFWYPPRCENHRFRVSNCFSVSGQWFCAWKIEGQIYCDLPKGTQVL